ncbi:ABC-type transport system involved in multi-copper enzyme maturation permease subunit [Thermosporothrix hazakensis]|jgi:ABC-type transport system involved in multi-copper enzyme maturation permease subunit|uniref:ABC-type transport system involved in multi-copper enzyme maturation permease subunit n=1 Tax=Thermosporothrix hazakensis TaxID=644383 RepID=A0A326UGA7_THEHA|nr:hypothetical protein [Thermosporothrix hazakensis]PZW26390.1 ABC-type transport system involved in multi-copper enzyme maturation permease subunit [Thermosporothrix hazakensis]GCE48658.1 hypothetical protein KTH_35270 [Thermosporothrix hazakensis]
MFWKILYVECKKVCALPHLWIGQALVLFSNLLLETCLLLLRVLPLNSLNHAAQVFHWPFNLVIVVSQLYFVHLGGLVLLVLSALLAGQEFTWGSFHLWLTRGVPRWLLLTAKVVTLFLTLGLTIILSIVSVSLVSLFDGSVVGEVEWSEVERMALSLCEATYALLPLLLLSFVLALGLRSSLKGIVCILLLSLCVYPLFEVLGRYSQWVRVLVSCTPFGLSRALMSANPLFVDAEQKIASFVGLTENLERQGNLLPFWGIVGGLTFYCILFLLLAFFLFLRQDCTPSLPFKRRVRCWRKNMIH